MKTIHEAAFITFIEEKLARRYETVWSKILRDQVIQVYLADIEQIAL